MRIGYALGCLGIVTATVAHAAEYRTSGAYPACLTSAMYREAVTALVNRDERHFNALTDCIVTRADMKIVPVDYTLTGGVQVRMFAPDGQSLLLWTNRENVKKID